MYLEGTTSLLEDSWMRGEMFDISPADSLINFELPSSLDNDSDWPLSGLNCNSDVFINSVHSDLNLTDSSPVLFDFADLDDFDKNDNFDDYLLEALSNDQCNETPIYGSDSTGNDDALGRLSVLGIELESMCQESMIIEEQNKSVEVEKKQWWGEPIYCPEHHAYRCPVIECGKLYAKASHVRAHLRRHSGEKPFRCMWGGCSWRFARSDELARHIRSHSGHKPYDCVQCGKKFARSDHLAKHSRVHAKRAAAAAVKVSARRGTTTRIYRRQLNIVKL